MNRTAVIAIVMIESAGLGVGPLWAAPIEGAPTTESAAPDAESLAAGLARLGAAMTRALPGGSPRSSAVAPSVAETSAPKLCKDGAVAPDIVRKMIEDEAAGQNVDVKLAVTIAAQESNFGALVNSPAAAAAGAMGVMQLTPETAARYAVVDRCDVPENIRGGVSYIRDLSAQFGGNVFLVLAAYNAGEKRVYAAKGVPPISETVRYVAAAANTYYDFASVLNSPEHPKIAAAKTPVTDPSESQADSVGQKWIGGSVLYVEQEK